jgi:hypothetical protein
MFILTYIEVKANSYIQKGVIFSRQIGSLATQILIFDIIKWVNLGLSSDGKITFLAVLIVLHALMHPTSRFL